MILDSQASSGPRRRLVLMTILAVALFAGPAFAGAAHGYLGVHLQDLDDALLVALDLEGTDHGVLVRDVVEDSPAEEAGIEQGDVIISFDGTAAKSVRGLTRRVRRSKAGDEVTVEVLRKGKTKKIEVTLGKSPQSRNFAFFSGDDDDIEVFDGDIPGFSWRRHGVLGARIETLGKELGRYFGTEEGALVLSVAEDSAAEEAGLQPGDVILAVDGEEVEDTTDLQAALSDYESGDRVKIDFLREKKKKSVEVELQEDQFFTMVIPDGKNDRFPGPPRAPQGLHKFRGPRMRLHQYQEMRGDRSLREKLEELQEQVSELRAELEELHEN